jgi:hypothetical protein
MLQLTENIPVKENTKNIYFIVLVFKVMFRQSCYTDHKKVKESKYVQLYPLFNLYTRLMNMHTTRIDLKFSVH